MRDLPLRLGLIGAGLVVFEIAANFWNGGESFRLPVNLALSYAAWGIGIALFIAALVERVHPRLSWLAFGGLIAAQIGYAYLSQLNYSPLTASHSDNEMAAEYSAQVLRRGMNPYTWDYTDSRRAFRDSGAFVTVLLDGSVQSRLTYPALPTMLLAGLDLIGIGKVRIVSTIFQIALICLVFIAAPERLRPLAVLPLFAARSLIFLPLNGTQDVVWSVLLVGMILAWKKPVLRAVLFGLACSFRQQPWFVAPFLLIALWNESGAAQDRLRRLARFAAISAGVFALINLPFIVWDARAWWLGVFEPVYAAFNVYSQGLGALSQFDIAPLPRQFYTALQMSSFAFMLVLHWRHPRTVGQAFWIFPAVFFWLYYRGLANYWLYWFPPMLVIAARSLVIPSGAPSLRAARNLATDAEAPRWRLTIDIAFGLLVVNALWGIFLLLRQPTVAVGYYLPLETDTGARVVRMGVSVSNLSDRPLTPRFAIQHDPGGQALPWRIDSGPQSLAPDETGQYTISGNTFVKTFDAGESAQVVVTDAGGDYELRAVLTLPADDTFDNPDLVVNPAYTYWPAGANAPTEWSIETSGGASASSKIGVVDGQKALTIKVEADSSGGNPITARIAQTITFPAELSIWVRPTFTSADPRSEAYGLELDDGVRKLWILFGNSNQRVVLHENAAYAYLSSPLNQWSRLTIDPRKFYDEFGWPLPPYSVRRSNGIEFAARQVKLSLLLATSGAEASAMFGRIEQDGEFASPAALVADALTNPETYYANLADEYRRQRNDDLAEAAQWGQK